MDFIDLIDRIVKSQHLYHSILEGNEAQTRWLLIDPLILEGWGFNREDIIVEYSLDSIDRISKYNKLDYCLLVQNRPKLLIEAKSLGINLFEKYTQLEDYFLEILKVYDYEKEELIGILTDGDVYLFYTNKEDKSKMDKQPFLSIRLSVSEEFARYELLAFCKNKLGSKIIDTDTIGYDEEYELYTKYRIDSIDGVLNYFESKDISVGIDKVSIYGKDVNKINSFKKLYRYLLNEINIKKPNLLYSLAKQEDYNANGKISNIKFSCKKINSTDIEFKTKDGIIYITMPNTTKGIIERIISLIEISDFGLSNVTVSMKKVKKGFG